VYVEEENRIQDVKSSVHYTILQHFDFIFKFFKLFIYIYIFF